MDIIRIKKAKLLAKVTANRAAHKKDYDEAVIGHRAETIKSLEKKLADIKAGGPINIYTFRDLETPISKVAEYDRVITILEMTSDTEIELTMREFDNYIMDNWEWKHAVLSANSTYLSKT